MRSLVILGSILLISATSLFADAKAPALEELSWMAGSWIESNNGVETEEHWLQPKGALMLGINRTTRRNSRTSFEFLRLAIKDGKIVYFASPGGRAATEFPVKEISGRKVVFENLSHDFPQRVIYWIDAGNLLARIEGDIKGVAQSKDWTFRPMKSAAAGGN